MGEHGAERVLLALNHGEPISGTISGASGDAEPFRGWLELAGKVERLREGASEHRARPTRAHDGRKEES